MILGERSFIIGTPSVIGTLPNHSEIVVLGVPTVYDCFQYWWLGVVPRNFIIGTLFIIVNFTLYRLQLSVGLQAKLQVVTKSREPPRKGYTIGHSYQDKIQTVNGFIRLYEPVLFLEVW